MKNKAITLLDGGTGQEIYKRSNEKAHPLWAIQVMLEQPKLVRRVHEEYILAGCNAITLNTYTATPPRLRRDSRIQDPQLLTTISKTAIDLATSLKRKYPSIQIAGCLSPLVASYLPAVKLSYEECLSEYAEIVTLQQNDVDFFLCETMANIRETLAAVNAAIPSNKPIVVCFTLNEDGSLCLRSGEPLIKALDSVQPLPISGVMINCNTPETISHAMPTLARFCGENNLRFGGYANGFTSTDALKPGGTVDCLSARADLSPTLYADFTDQWLDMGATLLGGCCEISPTHMYEIHQRIVNDVEFVGV